MSEQMEGQDVILPLNFVSNMLNMVFVEIELI